MLIRYFILNAESQLRRVPQRAMEDVWQGKRPVVDLGVTHDPADDLRLLTVVMSKDLAPVGTYFLRLTLQDDMVTDEARADAARACAEIAGAANASPENTLARPEIKWHFEGYPEDWRQQLAAALDVPIGSLTQVFGVGGPLPMAFCMRVTVKNVLAYFGDENTGDEPEE